MHEEQPYYPPQLDFNLSSYQRDEAGLIANIEEAREIIRSLQSIIRFLEVSPFEQLSLNIQAEISLYLVGTHLLTHNSEQLPDAKVAALEAIFNEHFAALIQSERNILDPSEILHTVEDLFKDFGK